MMFHEAETKAAREPIFRAALVASLRNYKGCPACNWTGKTPHDPSWGCDFDAEPDDGPSLYCIWCKTFRAVFLAGAA